MGPSWGISRKRSMILIWSIECIEGERPGGFDVSCWPHNFPFVEVVEVTIDFQVEGRLVSRANRFTSMNAEDLVIDDHTQC